MFFGPSEAYLLARSYMEALIVQTGSYTQTIKTLYLKGKVKFSFISWSWSSFPQTMLL